MSTRVKCLAAGGVALVIAGTPVLAMAKDKQVLLFSHTTGFRHKSIETGVAAIKALGARNKITVTATEDPAIFNDADLKKFDAIILLNNTTKPDDPSTEYWRGAPGEAFQRFVQRGGGVVGIHGASDSHYGWRWYGRLIGGYFERHPKGTYEATITMHHGEHAASASGPREVKRTDEWYYFKDFDPTKTLLVTNDPQSFGQPDYNPNPVAWAHTMGKARVFYTAMGHTEESYSEPWFMQHLQTGIDWVLRRKGKK